MEALFVTAWICAWLQQLFPLPIPLHTTYIKRILVTNFSYAFYFIFSLSKWEISWFHSLGKPFSVAGRFFWRKSHQITLEVQNLLSYGRTSFMLSERFSGFKGCLGFLSHSLKPRLCLVQCLELKLHLSWTVHKNCRLDVWTWSDITRMWNRENPCFSASGKF